nr:ABC transporter ATP-binding protein [uncultured Ruminococcus sp.]
MEAIRTKELVKKYKDLTAVKGLDLTVHKGELYALLGVNGAGKSTTIKMLSCLTRPTSGDAEVMGHSIVSDSVRVREIINVSPQETAVAAKLSVRENLEFIARIYGSDKAEAKRKTDKMIEDFSLQDVENKRAATLSGGWQRRLSIAMALITEPEVLFLDEPTLGLDVLARRELWHFIESLKGRMTIILTTHYLEEAESLSDRIGVMAHGVLCAEGTAAELKEKAGTDDFEEAFIRIAGEEVK